MSKRERAHEPVPIDGACLTLQQVVAVANGARVVMPEAVHAHMRAAHRIVEQILARGATVYGVNTGFGALADVPIAPDQIRRLQVNLLRSHACGVGAPLAVQAVRAMMALRAHVLAMGYSGCRPALVQTLVRMLNAGIHPVVPSRGSVGASGDLAPLAHLGLVVIGEGEAWYEGGRLDGGEALRRAGIPPVRLEAKEGLALLNGTQAMCSVGGLAIDTSGDLCIAADIIGAMTLEALRGTPVAFDARIQAVRPHPGQQASAARLRGLIEKSSIRDSHKDPAEDPRVQDAYSIRCMPQVHGAVSDAVRHAREVVEIEINSATDNPLVFAADSEVLSGGNFHGEPVALACDYASIAVADLGTISERRVERLVNPALSGLPAFLARDPGMDSGMMLAQVTAAALVAEDNVLVHPASVCTLPTSANKEDHVSMGMTAALKLGQIVENVTTILAIEWMCAAQALEFLRPLRPGPILSRAYRKARRVVPPLDSDTPLAGYIQALARLVPELANELKPNTTRSRRAT